MLNKTNQENHKDLNKFLVSVFHQILLEEQKSLLQYGVNNLTIREIHVLEQLTELDKEKIELTVGNLSKKIAITDGSTSVIINRLVKKDYLKKKQDQKDKRKYILSLTTNAHEILKIHEKWHDKFIKDVVKNISSDESKVLITALKNIANFINKGEEND